MNKELKERFFYFIFNILEKKLRKNTNLRNVFQKLLTNICKMRYLGGKSFANNFAYKYQWDMESIDLQDYFNKSGQMVSEEFKSNEEINLEFE